MHCAAGAPSSLVYVDGDHGDLGHHGVDLRVSDRLGDSFVCAGIGDDLPGVAFVVQVVAAGIEHDTHELVLVGRVLRDGDDALLRKHEADGVGLTQVAAVLCEGVADFADGAVAVVRGAVDDDGDAARAIALEGDFLVLQAGYLSGARAERRA